MRLSILFLVILLHFVLISVTTAGKQKSKKSPSHAVKAPKKAPAHHPKQASKPKTRRSNVKKSQPKVNQHKSPTNIHQVSQAINQHSNVQNITHPPHHQSTHNKPTKSHKKTKKDSHKKSSNRLGHKAVGLKVRKTRRDAEKTCVNKAENCHDFTSFCNVNEYKSVLRKYCSLRCGFCAPEGNDCRDEFDRCSEWSEQGFCKSTFYSLNVRRSMCAKHCNLCSVHINCNEAHNKFVKKCLHLTCSEKKHHGDTKCKHFCSKNPKVCGTNSIEGSGFTTPASVKSTTPASNQPEASGSTPKDESDDESEEEEGEQSNNEEEKGKESESDEDSEEKSKEEEGEEKKEA